MYTAYNDKGRIKSLNTGNIPNVQLKQINVGHKYNKRKYSYFRIPYLQYVKTFLIKHNTNIHSGFYA